MWKRRLQNKIKELRKDLSQLEASKDKDISNFRHWERLKRKYKRLNLVTEELKQRITAIAAKVRRYQGWVDSHRQNRLFENNQRFGGLRGFEVHGSEKGLIQAARGDKVEAFGRFFV